MVVEHAAQPVAAEIAHHRAALGLGVALDGVADVAQVRAGLHRGDAAHQAFIGDLDQALGLPAHLAHIVHAARVAMPAIDDQRHVDVDDVAVAQRLVVGNAVADDMVDRGADRLGIAAIVEGAGTALWSRANSTISWSSSSVVTPGLTCGTSRSSASAVSRPALRMPSKSSGPCSLMRFDRRGVGLVGGGVGHAGPLSRTGSAGLLGWSCVKSTGSRQSLNGFEADPLLQIVAGTVRRKAKPAIDSARPRLAQPASNSGLQP